MPAFISAAQAVEHYEITRYGTQGWADRLGYKDAVNLLDATFQEESRPTRFHQACRNRRQRGRPEGCFICRKCIRGRLEVGPC